MTRRHDETIFFLAVYARYAHLLATGRGYQVPGVVDEDYGALTVNVSVIRPL
ncbi:MAG: hypothetical protein ACK5PS_11710 [Desulfopila sp.]